LRRADAKALTNAQNQHVTKVLEIPITPTIDDYFLLDTPEIVAQSWDTKKSDIIIGVVRDEGTYFSIYAFEKFRQEKTKISYDVFISTLRDIFKERPAFEKDAIITHYTNWKNLEDGEENHKRISQAIGDAFFVCPCRDFAQKWAGRGLNVFFYAFTQRTLKSPWANWMGVMHGDEIEYAFGKPVKSTDRPEGEVNVSLKFMELIGNFARRGNPSPNWEKYTPENQVYLDLNGTITSDHSTPELFGPKATECAFWNNYLPRLRKSFESNSCPAGSTTQSKLSAKLCGERAQPPLLRKGKFGW
jgi:acetylcholinesterase